MHCPLSNGHCAWSILPVGGANGILLGTASWQQAGYTRVGHLGRLASGCPTDTAGLSLAWAPVPGGSPGGAPRCRALGQEQTTGGSKITLREELFAKGRAWLFPEAACAVPEIKYAESESQCGQDGAFL